jgi:eukaryotic-like serine/threonine-protein kinase
MERLSAADPRWIGDFRLLGRLGEGGMGRVYLARSRRGRTVAVKVVQNELARQPDFRRRFSQEITAARKVGDTWTAPVLDADTEAETPWVATGYIAGPSLAEVVDDQYGPLPAESVTALASGLVRALKDIHGAGLVHRDLKPSNILITIDGPRVIDFGIARALDSAVQSAGGLTRTGALVGSPGFMSPEQVRGQHVTPASDIFCLGAVLAYAATGRMPFGTSDSGVHALLFRIAEEEPELSGLSGELLELVSSCLAKDPERRPDLQTLLSRTEGELKGTWLPGEVLAQLGRHAVQLLDSEDPEGLGETYGGPAGIGVTGPAAPPRPANPQPSTPTGVYGPPVSAPPYAGPQHQQPQPQQPWQQGLTGPSPQVPNGFAPSGPGTPPPSTPVPAGRVISPRKPAQIVTVLLSLGMVIHVISLIIDVVISNAIDDASGYYGVLGVDTVQGFSGLKGATIALEFVSAPVGIALAVMWLVWFWRTRLNAESFSPGRIRYAEGMAVGGWLIPFVNVIIPKQVINDIWTASNPAVPQWHGYGPRPTSRRGLVNGWWTMWLIYFFFGLFSSWESWYDASSIEDAEGTIALALFTDLFSIPAAILALILVSRLTTIQDERLAGR